MAQTSCVTQSSQLQAKATGDIKERWQPALLVPGLSQSVVPVCLKELWWEGRVCLSSVGQ